MKRAYRLILGLTWAHLTNFACYISQSAKASYGLHGQAHRMNTQLINFSSLTSQHVFCTNGTNESTHFTVSSGRSLGKSSYARILNTSYLSYSH